MLGDNPRVEVRSLSAFSFVRRACRRAVSNRHEQGAALLFVLLMMGVLAAVFTAFLLFTSRQTAVSSAETVQSKVESLTEFAWRDLVRSLQDEMLAGSVNPQGGGGAPLLTMDTENGKGRLLFPASAKSAVPGRMAEGLAPNLLKWSSSDTPFYGDASQSSVYPQASLYPPPKAAAPASTADPAQMWGRVDPQRWDAPRLLSGSAPIPDWILVSSKGEKRVNLLTNATDPIVARYAYMVYDEGGLVDMNVAGFPSNLDRAFVAGKGTPRLLDLMPILAASGMSEAEARSFNDALVQWRDAGIFAQESPPSSLQAEMWLHPFTLPSRVVGGRRALISRTALLRSVLTQMPGPLQGRQNFLTFAGTFSRALEQPSLQPVQPGSGAGMPPPIRAVLDGGNDAAGSDLAADHSKRLNPPFLQLRVKAPFTRADGVAAVPGEPLVLRRFPLRRLDLVRWNAVSPAGSGGRVEQLFGLTRASPADPWRYRPGQTSIKTLYEVANLSGPLAREPDFVELLKAAIQGGGFGAHPDPDDTEWSRSLDRAVLQVAANLVDQYDADRFPTRISLDRTDGTEGEVSGVERLPYLHGLRMSVGTVPSAYGAPVMGVSASGPVVVQAPTTNKGRAVVWQRVELWDPNAVDAPLGSVPGPTQFRLRVESDSAFSIQAEQPSSVTGFGGVSVTPRSGLPKSVDLSDGWQWQFDLGADQLQFFASPQWMEQEPALSSLAFTVNADQAFPSPVDASGKPWFGVRITEVDRVFPVSIPPKNYTVYPSRFRILAPPMFTYRMEYYLSGAGGGSWIAYDEKRARLEQEIYWEDPALPLDSSSPNALVLFPDPRAQETASVTGGANQTEASLRAHGFKNEVGTPGAYTDADGLIRRAAGSGLSGTLPTDVTARPRLLNRPFRSVGEMACAFSGNPWRQLDFSTPETPFAGLLDVFCIAENDAPRSLVEGRINLNTRQLPVLEAALSGVARTLAAGSLDALADVGDFSTESIASAVLARSQTTPFRNLSDLAGRWTGGTNTGPTSVAGSSLYAGLGTNLVALAAGEEARHSAVRALADTTDTRVWNLLLDVIVQAGRYPAHLGPRGNLRKFVLEAERRVWVHVALDRLTGELLDWQLERPLE